MPGNCAGHGEAGRSGVVEENAIGREGQSLMEYTLILLLVALVCIGAVTLIGATLGNLYSTINASF